MSAKKTGGGRSKAPKMPDPKTIKKVGILTGGGDCPGLNAVIKGFVRNASSRYGWKCVGVLDGFDGLLDRRHMALTPKEMSGLQLKGGTILGTSNRGNPLHYPIREKGKSYFKDVTGEIVANISKMKIDALAAVGGDGTMKIAQALFEKGVPIVGVPKTIDNDLDVTDVTFGFNSAVTIATDALDRLHTTAESHHRLLVLEVMGRDCGWIALEAGIAGGADVILIPEIPFDINVVCDHVTARRKRGKRFSIVIVAEGAFPQGGRKVYEKEPGADGTPGRLGGIGRWVAEKVSLLAKIESRVTVLGHIQRGGTPTTYDRILAMRFGVEAANLVGRGDFGRMVCLKGRDIKSASIAAAVKKLKRVDPGGQMVGTAESLGASLGRPE